jgi:NAD(P)H-dependent flavin oxidoreductase YrpB (nitropropane dioxygenase family)
MGTRFIATDESMADIRYKDMLVRSNADDILLTRALTGLQTNMLRPSIVAAGLDPEALSKWRHQRHAAQSFEWLAYKSASHPSLRSATPLRAIRQFLFR